jgi:hypothetical protein
VSISAVVSVAILAGCDGGPNEDVAVDVTGPYAGPVHRYVVDSIALPQDVAQGSAYGDDLTGRGGDDNALASAMQAFRGQGDVTTHALDMIAAGQIASSIVLQTDDLEMSPAVGVSYIGAQGDAATPVGGQFTRGMLATNRTRTTRHPGSATARLPIFADADPIDVELDGFELDLSSDGGDGYIGLVRLLDADRDGTVTADEVASSGFLASLLGPDVDILGDKPVFSVGFQIHLAPCGTDDCASGSAVDPCFDRVRDARETDVDCGGSCIACPASAACGSGGDCQSGTCDGGACAAPSCTDGIRDGLESDVDCGDSCGPCQLGRACDEDTDCTTLRCSGDAVVGGASGTCLAWPLRL